MLIQLLKLIQLEQLKIKQKPQIFKNLRFLLVLQIILN